MKRQITPSQLRALMARARLNQKDAAAYLGVTVRTVGNWTDTRKRITNIPADALKKITDRAAQYIAEENQEWVRIPQHVVLPISVKNKIEEYTTAIRKTHERQERYLATIEALLKNLDH